MYPGWHLVCSEEESRTAGAFRRLNQGAAVGLAPLFDHGGTMKIHCPECRGIFRVEGRASGTDFNCPFCYALNERLHAMNLEDRVEFRSVQHDPSASSADTSRAICRPSTRWIACSGDSPATPNQSNIKHIQPRRHSLDG